MPENLHQIADPNASANLPFRHLFSGRLSGTNYFFAFAVLVPVSIIDVFMPSVILSHYILYTAYLIPASFVAAAASTRRLHDIGRTGEMAVWSVVPVVGSIYAFFLWLKKGDLLENTYGPPPDPNKNFFEAFFKL